jgi:hypothetical protein
MLDGTNPQPPEAQSGIDSAELYLRQGEPLLAYNAVQDGLRVSPGNLRLRQLKGLVLARSGDVERANQLLSEQTAGIKPLYDRPCQLTAPSTTTNMQSPRSPSLKIVSPSLKVRISASRRRISNVGMAERSSRN